MDKSQPAATIHVMLFGLQLHNRQEYRLRNANT